jgi:hypothetical protein
MGALEGSHHGDSGGLVPVNGADDEHARAGTGDVEELRSGGGAPNDRR